MHKRDGGIRICGDFKVSINPVICSQVYPLPTPDEMFSMLANGESYTKLDLARAYKQMAVKKECQNLLTINTHMGLFQYTRLSFGISTAPSLWQKVMAQVLQGLRVWFVILTTYWLPATQELNTRNTLEVYLTSFANMVFMSRGPNVNFSKSSWNFWAILLPVMESSQLRNELGASKELPHQ